MQLDHEGYSKYNCVMLLFYLIILIFGIVLACLDFGSYGEVVYNETYEWNKNVITDVTVEDYPQCPQGYELLTTLYLGTNTYCLDFYGNYRLGTCSSSSSSKSYSSGRTIYGFSDTLLSQFNGKYICYARSPSENFLSIVSSRIGEAVNQTSECLEGMLQCGPDDISLGYTYCSNSTECPLDGIFALPNTGANQSVNKSTYSSKVEYNDDWNFYLQTKNTKPHMAELYISLSPPCFDSSNTYVQRQFPISNVYDEGSCDGLVDGSKLHKGYVDTHFNETERNVLYNNGILNQVAQKVPNYREADLEKNAFSLYYKPYASWQYLCTVDGYGVQDIQQEGIELMEIVTTTWQLMIASIIIFVIQLIFAFVLLAVAGDKSSEFSAQMPVLMQIITAYISFIVLITYYIILVQAMGDIDGTKIKYFVDNSCSDYLLNYSLGQVLELYNKMNTYIIVGIVLAFLGCVVQTVFTLIAFGACRKNEGGQGSDYGTFHNQNPDGMSYEINKDVGGDYKHNF